MSAVKFNLKNNGPNNSNATYVSFEGLDTLTIESITPSKGTMRDNVWTVGALDLGETVSLTITATPREGYASHVKAKAYGDKADLNMSNNYAEFVADDGNDNGNSASCEAQFVYDRDSGLDYLKFSIKTSDEIVTHSEGMASLFYYDIYNPDNQVGEFIGGIPDDLEAFSINVYGDNGNVSPFYEIEVDGFVSNEDDSVTTYVRKPSTPLNHADLFDHVSDMATGGMEHVGNVIESLLGQELCAVLAHKDRSVNIPVVASTSDFRVRTSGSFDPANLVPIAECPDAKNAIEAYGGYSSGVRVLLSYKKEGATSPVGKIDYDMEGVDEIHLFLLPDNNEANMLVKLAPGFLPENMYLFDQISGVTLWEDEDGSGWYMGEGVWYDNTTYEPQEIIFHFAYHSGI